MSPQANADFIAATSQLRSMERSKDEVHPSSSKHKRKKKRKGKMSPSTAAPPEPWGSQESHTLHQDRMKDGWDFNANDGPHTLNNIAANQPGNQESQGFVNFERFVSFDAFYDPSGAHQQDDKLRKSEERETPKNREEEPERQLDETRQQQGGRQFKSYEIAILLLLLLPYFPSLFSSLFTVLLFPSRLFLSALRHNLSASVRLFFSFFSSVASLFSSLLGIISSLLGLALTSLGLILSLYGLLFSLFGVFFIIFSIFPILSRLLVLLLNQ